MVIEVMWRCTVCGKWSHARRKPRDHERWVQPGDPLYVEEQNQRRAPDGWLDPNMPDAHPIRCGPFENWVAKRIGED